MMNNDKNTVIAKFATIIEERKVLGYYLDIIIRYRIDSRHGINLINWASE